MRHEQIIEEEDHRREMMELQNKNPWGKSAITISLIMVFRGVE
jgi:hypothetical protein